MKDYAKLNANTDPLKNLSTYDATVSDQVKDFSEMEFLNPITTEEGHQIFKKDENKDFSFATLNKVKTDFFRKNLKKNTN